MVRDAMPFYLRRPHARRSQPLTPRMALLTATLTVLGAAAPAVALGSVRAFILPSSSLGEVRPLQQKRIDKGLVDTLGFTGKVTAVADPTPVEEPGKGKKIAVVTKEDPRLRRADALRQEGTDLQQAGHFGAALAKLEAAIAAYRTAFGELVDYTKLADAYARAGVCAFAAGKGAARASALFDDGLLLQPTLAIDRRKADKALLELFDGRRAALESAARGALRVEGDYPGAEAFVDGVRLGTLPASAEALAFGEHYVQVRGEGWLPFAKKATVGRKPVVLKVKLKPVPQRPEVGTGKVIAVDELAHCTAKGEFIGRPCAKLAAALAKQTACGLVVHPVIVADRYGRLTLHAFVQRDDGKTIALQPRELDKALTDLNARLTELAEELGAVAEAFPTARALDRKPKVFR